MSTVNPPAEVVRGGARIAVQRFGAFLSGMIMPNISAFIAWGLITSLFISTGWLELIPGKPFHWISSLLGGFGNPDLIGWKHAASALVHNADGTTAGQYIGLVGPIITYLLPLLIANQGGRMVYAANPTRGGVVAAVATMGVIVGTTIPMFLGAMIIGPLAGWLCKHMDRLWEGKLKPGFEMLVNNFSGGILGGVLAVAGFFGLSPLVTWVSDGFGSAVNALTKVGLLPLLSIFVEPGKVLFLNNAINHGVFTPLGTEQVRQTGASVLFLVEANPGPGLGLLVAYWLFGVGIAKQTASTAILIQFLGGIHEIYFPYVLMKPKVIAATILGGMAGVTTNVLFHGGLHAPASPGSIFAVLASANPDTLFGTLLSVVISAGVSFFVAGLLLRIDRRRDLAAEAESGDQLAAAVQATQAAKGKESAVLGSVLGGSDQSAQPVQPAENGATVQTQIRTVVFACDAGMGSSAMGASVLRKRLAAAGVTEVTVVNKAIANLAGDEDLIITHRDLTDRARRSAPNAIHVSVENFMNSPKYDDVVRMVVGRADGGRVSSYGLSAGSHPILDPAEVHFAASATRADAIAFAGSRLVATGAVDPEYAAAMAEREQSVSTYMGKLLAIPHGTDEARAAIRRTALVVTRYDEPIDWGGDPVRFVIGIAAIGGEHLELLSHIAVIFSDKMELERLCTAATPDELFALVRVS